MEGREGQGAGGDIGGKRWLSVSSMNMARARRLNNMRCTAVKLQLHPDEPEDDLTQPYREPSSCGQRATLAPSATGLPTETQRCLRAACSFRWPEWSEAFAINTLQKPPSILAIPERSHAPTGSPRGSIPGSNPSDIMSGATLVVHSLGATHGRYPHDGLSWVAPPEWLGLGAMPHHGDSRADSRYYVRHQHWWIVSVRTAWET